MEKSFPIPLPDAPTTAPTHSRTSISPSPRPPPVTTQCSNPSGHGIGCPKRLIRAGFRGGFREDCVIRGCFGLWLKIGTHVFANMTQKNLHSWQTEAKIAPVAGIPPGRVPRQPLPLHPRQHKAPRPSRAMPSPRPGPSITTATCFSFPNHNNTRDKKPFRKNRSPFFILKSISDISGKNAPRFFYKKRIVIENAARGCGCRRAVCRGTCAQVVNFSRSDSDFHLQITMIIAIEKISGMNGIDF